MDLKNLNIDAISNSDRHENNFDFGALRDSETQKSVSVAPLFDHGNSMSFNSPDVDHEMEMLGGIIPYVDQKPNPKYFEKHPEADRNLVVTNIPQMEQTWNAFFAKPKEEKKAHPIEWEGKTYSLSVFEDKYLFECQKAGAAPDQTILKHFKEVCVDMCGYKPKFYKEKQKDISHKQ